MKTKYEYFRRKIVEYIQKKYNATIDNIYENSKEYIIIIDFEQLSFSIPVIIKKEDYLYPYSIANDIDIEIINTIRKEIIINESQIIDGSEENTNDWLSKKIF